MPYDTVVGIVPRVVIRRGLRSKEFALVITGRRSIFALENPQRADPKPAPGPGFNYERADPDVMATDPKNFVIMHEWLEKIQLKKSIFRSRYELRLEYMSNNRKRKKVRAQLIAPVEVTPQNGPDRKKDPGLNYAKTVRALYQRSFPGSFFEELAEWKI